MLPNPDAVQNRLQPLYKTELDKLKRKDALVADITGVHAETSRNHVASGMSIKIWTIALGALMTTAGIAHFAFTRKYLPIVPRWFPQRTGIVILSGLVELSAGIGLFFPQTRKEAALVVLVLMLGFLPLHTWDLFRDRPAIGPHWAAAIRLALQFVLIYWALYVWRPG
jgi:uncharacterized membrane protein